MRHFKRFKNWLVPVYYACWTFSKQLYSYAHKSEQPGSYQPTANRVTPDEASMELEANTGAQPSNQRSEAIEPAKAPATVHPQPAPVEIPAPLETKETLDHQPSSPSKKAVIEAPVADDAEAPTAQSKQAISPDQKSSPEPVAAQTSPVHTGKPQRPQAAPVVSANIKQPGTNGAAATEPQAATGKYQPGTITDQTAQRLARLLVSEIKLYYKNKTEGEGLGEENIYDLLKEPIEQSRKHYKKRIGPNAIKTMPDYFYGELVRSLCGGDASRLGPNYPTDEA
jgi:hypothetical protein